MISYFTPLLSALLFAGCAHSHPAAETVRPVPAAQAIPFTVSLQVEAQGQVDLSRRTIPPGESLHSQDSFALKIGVDKPAYVYALHYSPSGWSERLFPERGDHQLSPSQPLRLPSTQTDYHLDTVAGDEVIYVVASHAPMDDALCGKLRLRCVKTDVGTLSRGDEVRPPPPPPPPDGVSGDQRNPTLVKVGSAYTAVQASDPSGVAILRFAFQHTQ